MPEVVPFDKALSLTVGAKHRHVLLGNGFSRAWRDEVFSYQALFEEAVKEGLSDTAKRAFAALGTTDFEQVMRLLRQTSLLAKEFKYDKLARALGGVADELREVLVKTIASNHPDRPHAITPAQYTACRTFLSHFKNFYTVNYDLLLYWTLMQEHGPACVCDDGFRQPYGGPDEYVTWEIENTNEQNVHYLHGALHVFDAGHEVQKFTWVNTNIALIEQIRAALNANKYPLFVSEGTARSKLDRIQHSSYLGRAYRSFANCQHALFVFGLSMAENDEHVLRLIDRGKFSHVCVGLYGDPTSDANKRIMKRAAGFGAKRKVPPTIIFYDAASAKVWGA
jgi:hypothetical protein